MPFGGKILKGGREKRGMRERKGNKRSKNNAKVCTELILAYREKITSSRGQGGDTVFGLIHKSSPWSEQHFKYCSKAIIKIHDRYKLKRYFTLVPQSMPYRRWQLLTVDIGSLVA
jgi:hypothetical protein